MHCVGCGQLEGHTYTCPYGAKIVTGYGTDMPAPQPTGGAEERLAKWGNKILDNFNEAVVSLSLTVADEKEWAKRYEKLKSQTLSAFDDSILRPILAAERTKARVEGIKANAAANKDLAKNSYNRGHRNGAWKILATLKADVGTVDFKKYSGEEANTIWLGNINRLQAQLRREGGQDEDTETTKKQD